MSIIIKLVGRVLTELLAEYAFNVLKNLDKIIKL